MTEPFDIFNLFSQFSKKPLDTKQQATMDYIYGKIDGDTYIRRMQEIDRLNSRTD